MGAEGKVFFGVEMSTAAQNSVVCMGMGARLYKTPLKSLVLWASPTDYLQSRQSPRKKTLLALRACGWSRYQRPWVPNVPMLQLQGSREQSHTRALTEEPLGYVGLSETLLSQLCQTHLNASPHSCRQPNPNPCLRHGACRAAKQPHSSWGKTPVQFQPMLEVSLESIPPLPSLPAKLLHCSASSTHLGARYPGKEGKQA